VSVNRARATAVMRENQLDAIVTTTPENLTYLTGKRRPNSTYFEKGGSPCL